MEERRITRVRWDGPFSWRKRDALLASDVAATRCGLYQIYGQHIVFGPGSLLYVGRATQRPLGLRLPDHAAWLQYESGVQVRLGVLDEPGEDELEVIKSVEALTIWWHSPPYNSQHIWTRRPGDLWVQNLGERGSLQPEYSTHWVSESPRPGDEPREKE